jgi:hypothetical protein
MNDARRNTTTTSQPSTTTRDSRTAHWRRGHLHRSPRSCRKLPVRRSDASNFPRCGLSRKRTTSPTGHKGRMPRIQACLGTLKSFPAPLSNTIPSKASRRCLCHAHIQWLCLLPGARPVCSPHQLPAAPQHHDAHPTLTRKHIRIVGAPVRHTVRAILRAGFAAASSHLRSGATKLRAPNLPPVYHSTRTGAATVHFSVERIEYREQHTPRYAAPRWMLALSPGTHHGQ